MIKKTPEEIEALKARTRAISLLAAIELTTDSLKDALKGQKPALEQLAKIERWKNVCMADLGLGECRLSAGMLRDCDRISAALDTIRMAHTNGMGTTTPDTMAAWLWCLDTLLADVRTVHGRRGACWRYLTMTWERFTNAWSDVTTGDKSEERGFAMYMDAADIIAPNGTGLYPCH